MDSEASVATRRNMKPYDAEHVVAGGAPSGGSRFWGFLLLLLILAVAVGPRMRFAFGEGGDGDLRLQDFAVPLVLAVGFAGKAPPIRLGEVWRGWARLYCFVLVAMSAIAVIVRPELQPLRTALFLARGLEIPAIALAVAILYVRAGRYGYSSTVAAVMIATAANTVWVIVQSVGGRQGVLFGGALYDMVESYGPKLIGEPSAYGAGFFFAFVCAFGGALFIANHERRLGTLILILGLVGPIVVQSRACSLAAVVICTVVLFRSLSGKVRRALVVPASLLAAALVTIVLTGSVGRYSAEAATQSGLYRMDDIWAPLLDAIGGSIWLGVGPGALGTAALPWTEAHNMWLRAIADAGIIGLAAVACMLGSIWLNSRKRLGDDAPTVRFCAQLVNLTVTALIVSGMWQDAFTAVTSTHLVMLTVGALGGSLSVSRSTSVKAVSP